MVGDDRAVSHADAERRRDDHRGREWRRPANIAILRLRAELFRLQGAGNKYWLKRMQATCMA